MDWELYSNPDYVDKLAASRAKPKEAPKKKTGRGGFLTSLISEGGAGLGAAIGSVLGPVGTIAGAGLGGFIGRLGENKIRDDEFKVGSAAGEGLTSAAFSGAGQAFKAIKGAKAAKGLTAALGGTDEAAKLVKGAGKSVVPGYLERKGLDKVSQAGGYFTKENVPGIGKVTSKEVNKYYGVLKKLKIAPNDAGDIEKSVTDRLGKLNTILEKQLTAGNKALSKSDIKTFSDEVLGAFKKQGGTTKEAEKYLRTQLSKLKSVKDIKGLHGFRKQLDDAINWNANADSATAQMQSGAKALREGIRDKLNSEVKGLADSNSLYHDLTDIQKLALRATGRTSSEATSNAGGLFSTLRSSPTANTVRAKVGGLMKEVGPYSAGTGGALTQATSQLRRQLPADLMDAANGALVAPIEDTAPPQGDMGQFAPEMIGGVMGASQQPTQSAYSLEQAIADIQAAPDAKSQKQIMDYYKFIQDAEGATTGSAQNGLNVTKPTSEKYSQALGGMQALQQLEALIQEGGVPKGTRVPGRGIQTLGIGSTIREATGTGQYDTLAFNTVDNLLRILTGAQAPESEIKRYMNQYIPAAGDSQATVQNKLNLMRQQFKSILSLAGQQDYTPTESYLYDSILNSGGM